MQGRAFGLLECVQARCGYFVSMSAVLSVDAGQTRCRLVAGVAEVFETDAVITDYPVLPQLADRIRVGIAAFGAVDGVAIGSTGLPDDATAAELLKLLADDGISQVWLAHDSITNYLAALGARQGVMVAAGTGVVTLAVGPRRTARVDGWGYLIGDAGSGYWIGRAGLEAVMRAFDGRGPETRLTGVVTTDFPDLPALYLSLQNDEAKVARIASYAQPVADLAATDEVCAEICRAAGNQLAHSANSALRRAELGAVPDPPVGLNGRIFGSAIIREEFCSRVLNEHPDAEFVDCHTSSLAGVELLAGLAPVSPLAKLVDSAAA